MPAAPLPDPLARRALPFLVAAATLVHFALARAFSPAPCILGDEWVYIELARNLVHLGRPVLEETPIGHPSWLYFLLAALPAAGRAWGRARAVGLLIIALAL